MTGAFHDGHGGVGTPGPVTRFDIIISNAAFSRAIVAAHAAYLFLSGITWPADDTHPYGVTWLNFKPAFMICGIGAIYAMWPALQRVGLAWVAVVGLASVTRCTDVLFDSLGEYQLGEQIRAFGWVFQWALVLVAYTQITAARALGRSTWASS
jgi:hypothetical protein